MGKIGIQNKNSKICVHWNVSPYDYSKEKAALIAAKVSSKYGLRKENIKVIPVFKTLNENGDDLSIASEVIQNIQEPNFQLKLFKDYIDLNEITDYDFKIIEQIDQELNAKIDYDVYDKYRHYSIKNIAWKNFLSYGDDNSFDFTQLKGLVLLNGEPANQSGKTTFAIDLLHFLLFGKTSKSDSLDKVFNKFKPSETECFVQGCLNIDGEDYIIKRTLTRPKLEKRTEKSKTVQKVSYYKIVKGENSEELQELEDYLESQEGEDNVQTNKIIKEAIGKESDFDLIISATSSNLDDLINTKDTERGKLLSRWIGLLPIEQKDTLAREKFNKEIKPYLLSNRYNKETVSLEIKSLRSHIESIDKKIKQNNELIEDYDLKINELESDIKSLLEMKQTVDPNIMKLDINTLLSEMEIIIENGKKKKEELSIIEDRIKSIGDVEFSIDEFGKLNDKKCKLLTDINVIKEQYKSFRNNIEALEKGEICPTCGRKYDNVDNSPKINELKKQIEAIKTNGINAKEELCSIEAKLDSLKAFHDLYNEKSSLIVKKSAIELKIANLRASYSELKRQKSEYDKNALAIDSNNRLNIQISNTNAKIEALRKSKENSIRLITEDEGEKKITIKSIEDRRDIIDKLCDEEILLKNWKIYLEMVGKNGISKMVLRKTLPIINSQLESLLCDVCDFSVTVSISDKNEVIFSIIKDGVMSSLSSGSGFEITAAALALRTVLSNMSTLPKINIAIFDEVLGRVAKENYDNMKTLYNKILENYDAIIQISHLEEIKDWHDKIITIKKENNISKIMLS